MRIPGGESGTINGKDRGPLQRFDTAAVTINGKELAERIKKNQFKIGELPGRPANAPATWAAVLAA